MPPLRRDIDVTVGIAVLPEAQAVVLMIAMTAPAVTASPVAAVAVTGVGSAAATAAVDVTAAAAALAAAAVSASAAVAADARPVVTAHLEAAPAVAVVVLAIALTEPAVDASIGVEVATVPLGGDLDREAAVDAPVDAVAVVKGALPATTTVPLRIDTVASRIVLAAPAVSAAVQVNAAVAGVVSAPATGLVTVGVQTLPVVSRAASVSVTPTVLALATEVAYRTAAVATTPAVTTTQQAITFAPSGMTKSGTQSFTTSWALLAGWSANTGTYPGSTVVNNALQVQGSKADATIAVSLPYSSTFMLNRRARIKVNGTVVATSAAFTAPSGTITVSATNVTVADGDDIAIDVITESYADGSISSGGTVTVT